jgi:hypothetical protein
MPNKIPAARNNTIRTMANGTQLSMSEFSYGRVVKQYAIPG